MWKQHELVMLSTNEKAILGLNSVHKYLFLANDMAEIPAQKYQHLYILSDEKIKEGDHYIVELFKITGESDGFHIERCNSVDNVWVNDGNITTTRHIDNCKKIIATTDKSLKWSNDNEIQILDYHFAQLPQPIQSFVEKFIEEYNKGNIITDVMVEYEKYDGTTSISRDWNGKLKINSDNTINIKPIKDSWNREEIIELFNKMYATDIIDANVKKVDFDKWVEEHL